MVTFSGENQSMQYFYQTASNAGEMAGFDNENDVESPKSNFLFRFSSKRIRQRLVEKNGEYNISLNNVEKQHVKFFSDIFTTMIELKWRWLMLVFVLSFLSSWLLFAILYYLIMLMHGDFNDSVGSSATEATSDDNSVKTPCLTNAKNFVSIFLFSLETQHTIGYGSRYPSEKCPEIVITLCLQSIFGLMMQCLLAGVVFAKLSRPHKRAETLVFSRHACISMRDGNLCFLFRVGDMRKSYLAEAHVRVQMISKRVTNEGELLPFQQFDMDVGFSRGLDRIFVAWPITICHVINESSPLYEYSAVDLTTARFEINVILEGVVQSGATMQARSSYLPSEIIWGSRFSKLVTYKRDNGKYEVDFSIFHKVYPVDTPMLSAKEMDIFRRVGLNFHKVYQCENLDQVINNDDTPYDSIQKQEAIRRRSIVDREYFGNVGLLQVHERARLLPLDNSSKKKDGHKIDYVDNGFDWSIENILRKHRKMSTMSRKLDIIAPTFARSASNTPSSCQIIVAPNESLNESDVITCLPEKGDDFDGHGPSEEPHTA